MFEHRLKLFLLVALLFAGLLIARLAQVQVFQSDRWRQEAALLARRYEFVETTRGTIFDRNGRVLATDEPCIDAAVDYRAILETPDEEWVKQQAEDRLHARLEAMGISTRRPHGWADMLAREKQSVVADLEKMWADLAEVANRTPDDMLEVRRSIVRRVETRRRYLWWRNFQNAGKKPQQAEAPREWYSELLGDQSPAGDAGGADNYGFDVAEQTQAHVVIPALDPDQQNRLARKLEHYPGLVLRPSKHRVYPFGRAACHVLGRLGSVGPNDVDPYLSGDLRHYWPNDPIGKSGIEWLCEYTLRGSRGQLETTENHAEPISAVDPIPGRDVRISLDIQLQGEIEEALVKRRHYVGRNLDEWRENQHGAAVVIDLASGEVLALASNPGFDPNLLDLQYPNLVRDELNKPLLNRATQMALEPGSSVKVIVGTAAITDKYASPLDTVECTGYLVLDGHEYTVGRCWIASQFEHLLGKQGVRHHPEPSNDPHPTGFLTISEGLERSCNVVFETWADRMGMHELAYWFDRFGLGRATGIGIEESVGMIPAAIDAAKNSPDRMYTWFAGIGQARVRATPLQMANVVATIARGGMWMRPHLVAAADAAAPTTRPIAGLDLPDRVDLHISAEAIDAIRRGMVMVVNERGGTGRGVLPESQNPRDAKDPLNNVLIAGKTGTAQAPMLTVPLRDEAGNVVLDEQRRVKHLVYQMGDPGTEGWYVGNKSENKVTGKTEIAYDHAWYVGFAPADHPRVAYCVMVEYGGAGGRVAGSIAHDVLVACARHGYLSASGARSPADGGQ